MPEKNILFESTFLFDEIQREDILDLTPEKIISSMITACAGCKKIRENAGSWISGDEYLSKVHDATVSHGLCPECYEKTMARIQSDLSQREGGKSAP